MNTIFRKSYHVEGSRTDFMRRLRPSALFDFYQDAATMAAEGLGFGHEGLVSEHGVVWVLTKLRTVIHKMPWAGDDITVETWHQESGKLTFDRDFYVYDHAGTIVAAAASVWVLMDVATREVMRADTIPFDAPVARTERALKRRLGKIRGADAPEERYAKTVCYSDIDLNGHVNNARYVDYALDCFPLERFREGAVRSVEMNYISEVVIGTRLSIRAEERGDGGVSVEGVIPETGKAAFRALIEFGAEGP